MSLFADPRIVTIPASSPFLDTLVDAIIAEVPAGDPFALADTIIFLPNRRAGAGLVDAFARRLGGAALLPAIRPLGDLDDDPDVWGPEPIALDVPPEIPPLRRRFELAELVRRRDIAEGGVNDPVRALAWADELCRLLDGAATGGDVDWTKLRDLVAERDLAQHWRLSAEFLDIVARYWPARLQADGLLDPAERRARLLHRLAASWRESPPQKPVIIAGSTGSVAATRVLMQAAMGLPRGCVVLPGLDAELDDLAWNDIDPQHPQHALRVTLEALGVARGEVRTLGTEAMLARARRRLVNEALAPANATADWRARLARHETPFGAGVDGLAIVEARNEEEEALAVALLLREAIETAGRTAALVTPDAGVARRVTARLARWGIVPQTTVGAALAESPHGVLLLLLADLLVDDGAPVSLLALLRHDLAGFGIETAARAEAVETLERRLLRGPRRWRDLADLAARPAAESARRLVEAVVEALAPLAALRRGGSIDLAAAADALVDAAESVARTPKLTGAQRLWSGPQGEAAAGVLRDMAEYGEALGPLEAPDVARALQLLLAARAAPPPRGGHPQIAILGPLEARLQRRDLMVLSGLVEGVWPAAPPEDPFLSRTMRSALGLPHPDARTGLAAHDFAQLACAPRVVLTFPAMREGAPTVPSRWVWRLRTLARAAGAEAALEPAPDLFGWVRGIDEPRALRRAKAPQPRPPVAARPERISFSRVETLIRDPYAIYVQDVLKLRMLEPPGAPPAPNHRGDAVHKAIDAFGDGDDPEALLALIDANLAAAGFEPGRRLQERARLAAVADAFVAWQTTRRAAGFSSVREAPARLDLGGGRFLTGSADCIALHPDEFADVLDYKTGATPTDSQVESGLCPQLTLEAAALERGGFAVEAAKSIPPRRVRSLVYWRFSGSKDGGARVVKFSKVTAADAAKEAHARLVALVRRYDDPAQPYLCKPRVQFMSKWTDYDHFARRAEWGDADDGDDSGV